MGTVGILENAALRASRQCVDESQITVSVEGAQLQAMLYRPEGMEKGAVLICSPDGNERIWTYRLLVSLARLLASHGVTVLRFDYMGQGESGGSYEEATVTTRLRDIELMAGVLRERTAAERIGLLGVRLGGALAIVASSRIPTLDFLVLWDPVLDVAAYFQDQLRINISSQMVSEKKVLRTREDLVQDILRGKTVSINGFNLSKQFFEEGRTLNIEQTVAGWSGRLLQIFRSTTRLPSWIKPDIVCLNMPAYWVESKVYTSTHSDLSATTLKWMGHDAISSRK